MAAIVTVKGLSKVEYEVIKNTAKAELNFRVNIRRHTNTPNTYGSIDIRPTAQQNHHWTAEQTNTVYEFITRHNLHSAMIYAVSIQNIGYVYARGFNYLRLIES